MRIRLNSILENATVFVVAAAFVLPERAHAAAYTPPTGCTPLATLRLPGCLVRQVSRCATEMIQDTFNEGVFTGRSRYIHPALFVRYDGADGYVSGHRYGPGTPPRTKRLSPGETYTYSRSVYRNVKISRAGDTGTEVMTVGNRTSLDLGRKRYPVLDIRFVVTEPKTGYRYRERAFLLIEPRLTIGVISTITLPGKSPSAYSSIPESISLKGEKGFLSNTPSLSCRPTS